MDTSPEIFAISMIIYVCVFPFFLYFLWTQQDKSLGGLFVLSIFAFGIQLFVWIYAGVCILERRMRTGFALLIVIPLSLIAYALILPASYEFVPKINHGCTPPNSDVWHMSFFMGALLFVRLARPTSFKSSPVSVKVREEEN